MAAYQIDIRFAFAVDAERQNASFRQQRWNALRARAGTDDRMGAASGKQKEVPGSHADIGAFRRADDAIAAEYEMEGDCALFDKLVMDGKLSRQLAPEIERRAEVREVDKVAENVHETI